MTAAPVFLADCSPAVPSGLPASGAVPQSTCAEICTGAHCCLPSPLLFPPSCITTCPLGIATGICHLLPIFHSTAQTRGGISCLTPTCCPVPPAVLTGAQSLWAHTHQASSRALCLAPAWR